MRTSDGVYVGEHLLLERDVLSAAIGPLLLTNPEVDAAVIESGRGGILSHGLGFEGADVGVVLNVAEDHLGLQGIHTLDDLARVKSVVPQAVKAGGWAVLNADDARVYGMRARTSARCALFTSDPDRVRRYLREHMAPDSVLLFLEGSTYVLQRGSERIPIADLAQVPLALGGAAPFQHGNILAAIAVAVALDIDAEAIRTALASFVPSPTFVPGRMNLIDIGGATALVDYAHNPPAMSCLMEFVRGFPAKRRIGVLSMPGDRRDEDIRAVGRLASGLDRVIVKENPDPRGRAQGEVAQLLTEGLREGALEEDKISVVLPELDAVRNALAEVTSGDLVAIVANQVTAVLELVESCARPPAS